MVRRGGTRGPLLGAAVLVVGLVGLLLPVLTTPVMSDSMYHYLLAPVRFPHVWDTIPWTVGDMGWRLRQGRIAPVGVWYQMVSYDYVMKASLTFGIETWVGEAVTKLLLVAGAVGSFHVLVGQLRDRAGSAVAHRGVATTLFAVLLVVGATTTVPERNGWTTFVQLCIGGVVILFGIGALALWAVNRWDGWGRRGRVLAGLLLAGAGAALVLSYELHWAAYPFALLLVLGQGRSSWRRLGFRAHRAGWAVVGWLSLGFLPMLAATRALIAHYSTDDYPGLVLALDGPVVDLVGRQLASAVPGTGLGQVRDYVATVPGAAAPRIGGGGGWFWGLLTAVGLVLVVRALLRTRTAPLADDGPEVPAAGSGRSAWLLLALAALVAAVAGALVLSVSEQSADIVRAVGDTYRGTPWIWACLAAAGTSLLVLLVGAPGRRALLLVTAVPALAALLVGVVVWPSNASAAEATRKVPLLRLSAEMADQVVLGPGSPEGAARRCDLDEAMPQNRYGQLARMAYEEIWGQPFCSAP